MALHLIPPDGGHIPSPGCPCRPELVDAEPVDGGTPRRAWQHRTDDTAVGVVAAEPDTG